MRALKNLIILTILLSSCNQVLGAGTAHLTAPHSFLYQNESQWNKLNNNLTNGVATVYHISYQGVGGYVHMGEEFIESIKHAESQGKVVHIDVTGNTASMHSLALCFGSKINFINNVRLMFHSVGSGKGRYRVRHDNSEYRWMWRECVRKGIITEDVYDLVQSGHVVYVYPKSGKREVVRDNRPYED